MGIIKILHPRKYDLVRAQWRILRYADNLADEGTSYSQARALLNEQEDLIRKARAGERLKPKNEMEGDFNFLVSGVQPELRPPFFDYHLKVLTAFGGDLEHRCTHQPYTVEEFRPRIEGGFHSFFGMFKIVFLDQDLTTNTGFGKLLFTHGYAEALIDLGEDLTRGLILPPRDPSNPWVDRLVPGRVVPNLHIDQYVLSKRGSLADAYFQQAPASFREFGGIMGLLMTADYYKRAFQLGRLRFRPTSQVIFASQKIGD